MGVIGTSSFIEKRKTYLLRINKAGGAKHDLPRLSIPISNALGGGDAYNE